MHRLLWINACQSLTLYNHLGKGTQVLTSRRTNLLKSLGRSSVSHVQTHMLHISKIKASVARSGQLLKTEDLHLSQGYTCIFFLRQSGSFYYLRSSQISGNVNILCHLHRQAKVHQNGFVWHQDDVTGCGKRKKKEAWFSGTLVRAGTGINKSSVSRILRLYWLQLWKWQWSLWRS